MDYKQVNFTLFGLSSMENKDLKDKPVTVENEEHIWVWKIIQGMFRHWLCHQDFQCDFKDKLWQGCGINTIS